MNAEDLFQNRFTGGWKQQRPGVHNENERLSVADDEIEDGPMPWWSGFVWIPLLLFALLFFAGLIYMLWSSLF